MNGEDYTFIKEIIKYLLAAFIYPLAVFYVKKFNKSHDKMKTDLAQYEVRLAVLQTRVDAQGDDLREIKESIDKLPERIKADIKDILNNGKR